MDIKHLQTEFQSAVQCAVRCCIVASKSDEEIFRRKLCLANFHVSATKSKKGASTCITGNER